jgi:hypothetical protein
MARGRCIMAMIFRVLLIIALCVGVAGAAEFDANSDDVFDDAYKFDVDNLVEATTQIAANVRAILKAADYAAIRALLDVEAGTDFNAYDADLTTYAGITPSANVQSLLGAADYAAMRALLDLEAGTDFYSMSAAGAAFEAIDSNDFDPDRLAGDTLDDNVIDAVLIGINEATAEASIAADDLILIYDTSEGAVNKMTRGNFVSGIGAGQAIILDLADDGSNESTDLGEIAVEGDNNSIFSEPSADKLHINAANNWPGADTAVAAASQVITDNAIATVDDADAADNDFAKFTANGLEGRSYAEVRQDLGIDSAANLETSLSLGAYASDILGAADSDALVTLLGLVAGDIPDLSATYEALDAEIMRADTNDTVTANFTWSGTNTFNGEVTMGADFNLNANEIQSTGNIVLQLGDNAGVNVFEIEDSDGNTIYSIDSDGNVYAAAMNDPYLLFNDNDEATEWAFKYSDSNDRLMVGTVTGGDAANNFTEVGYWHADGAYYAGNINISTGHTYQINGSQIALTNLSDGLSHAAGHIQGGADEIDGDLIDIDYAESNYTPATTGVASNVNHLAAHLEGIDDALGALGGGTLLGLTDVGGSDVYTGGYILVADNSNSYDPKAVGGDATLAADGTLTIAANAIENSMMADNSVDSAEIAAGSVDEPHLNVTNSPTDNYVLSYNAAGTNFTWVEMSGGGTDDQTLAEVLSEGADANDLDITSVNKLEGVDAAVYIDLGANGVVEIEADGSIQLNSDVTIGEGDDIQLTDDNAIELDATADGMDDDEYNGIIIGGRNCGENLGQWDTVYIHASDEDVWHEADASTGSGEFPAFGISVADCTDTNEARILVKGIVRNEGWSGMTPGTPIYLGETDGTLITNGTAPDTSGDCIQIVGWALSDSEIYFDFSRPYAEVE